MANFHFICNPKASFAAHAGMAQLRLTRVQYYLQYYHTKICIFNDKKFQINYE
jgi:hypothetical protein